MPTEIVPSLDAYNELEVLVPCMVRGADVEGPLGKRTSTAF